MVGGLDEALSEARLLHQEIIRYDAKLKLRIHELPEKTLNETEMLQETRTCRSIISDISIRIEKLALVPARLTSKNDRQSVLAQVNEHTKELEASKKDLDKAAQKARKGMEIRNRSRLLDGDVMVRRRKREEAEVEKKGEEGGERLALLVQRMASRVGQSEDAMRDIVRSSETLGKTHEEYHSQGAFIQTGNKLLSKWERRELTDKILVAIALLFYFAACFYVINKRFLNKFKF
uniref:Sec-20 n=1 Tax=Pristionchus pacificus TaxID=54126 RepID=A0A2A6BBK2_PRIPA|eukprot:PDM63272.1 sec-20 [Pristionchus pacificus]